MRKYFIIISIFFLSSCISFSDLEFRGVSSVSFSKNKECPPMCIHLDIFNPNNFSIKLQKAAGQVYISEKKIGDFKLENRVKLIGKKISTVKIVVSASSNQLIKTIINSIEFIFGKKIDLILDGKVKGKVYGISRKIDFNESYKLGVSDITN